MLKNKVILLIGVVGVCIITVVLFQQKQLTAVKAQIESPKLTLEVSTRQNSYVLLEPIPFDFKLSNQTNVPIKWGGSPALGYNINFFVTNADGEETFWQLGKYVNTEGIVGFREMPPNEMIESEALLNGKLLEMMFPQPGQYQVRAEFFHITYVPQRQEVKFLSNPITIDIREPQGINRQAYNYLKGPYETARRKSDSTPLQPLRQYFVDNFSSSVYTKYLIVELAGIYRGREDAKAVRELCKIYNLDFYHNKEVKRMLFDINAKLHPIVINPNLPPSVPLPVVLHPCTGNPINPGDF